MKKVLAVVLVLVMVLGLVACGGGGDTEEQTSISVQYVPTNAELADATTEAFAAYLENILGMEVNVTVATDYTTIVEAMEAGQVDVGIMPPAAYVQARTLGAAESILSSTLVDYDQVTEQPIEGSVVGDFKAEVIVRADSGIDSYEDLVGKKVAYLGVASASGYIYPVAEMKDLGLEFDTSNWQQISDVVSAMKAVYDGDVDACFTFEGSRYVFRNALTDAAGNPVDVFAELAAGILSEGDIPNDAIAVLPTMDDALKTKVQDAFLQMASEEEGLQIMSAWGHTGYVVSNEAAYDTIEDYMAKAAE